MKEGTKKNIYFELRTNKVQEETKEHYIQYTFGCYRIYRYFDHLQIAKLNPSNGVFVYMREKDDAYWDDDYPKNTAYEIFAAAKNKANGKKYTDPYKNTPIDEIINDSVNRFNKIFTEHAADIFPYDMPKQQYAKTIKEMKNILAQKIRQYKTK